jgi:hypothetical protein
MNAVFVRVPDLHSVDPVVVDLRQLGLQVEQVGQDRFRVHDDSDHAWMFLETDPGEVPPSLPELLSDKGPTPAVVIEYYSLRFLRRVLEAFASPEVVVDNDHGTTLSGQDFVARMDEDPEWDWRRPTTSRE